MLAAGVLTALGRSWRLEWEGLERIEAARRQSPGGNVIYAVWHSSLAILAWTHRRRDVQILVSQHRDGELIAGVLQRLGYGLVRGSSRRGGVQALFGLARELDAGRDVAVTVDGPVGPRYHVRAGVMLLARRTGRPIMPVFGTASRCTLLPTWDALRLPHPGARVRTQYGEPLWIASTTSAAELARAQRELEATLLEWTLAEETRWGRTLELADVQDRRSWVERQSERPDPSWVLRAAASAHGAGRRLETQLRPRPRGRGGRPWVVGIGNLEAGGTGKTPCVIALGEALLAVGCRLGVLTRGHGGSLGKQHPVLVSSSQAQGAADESRLLAAAFGPAVPLVASRDKRRGLELLRGRGDLDVILVDDALQTAALPVDRHLVLLDWESPFGNGWLLPAGRLREGPQALRRAQALLFTRSRGGVPRHPAWAHLRPEHCFLAREEFPGISRPEASPVAPGSLHGQGVVLLCGLGRPRAFEAAAATLAAREGFQIRRSVRLGDHADLMPALRHLTSRLERLDAAWVLVSRKDLLRLPPGVSKEEPLLVLEQRLHVDSLGELLRVLVPASAHLSAKSAKFTDTEP